jgi:hypothetical protein
MKLLKRKELSSWSNFWHINIRNKKIVFLFLGLSLVNCNNEQKTRIPTDLEITIWEEDFGQVQAMAGKLSRDVDGKPYVAKFALSDNEKLKIYNCISSSGILKLENDYDPKPNCV